MRERSGESGGGAPEVRALPGDVDEIFAAVSFVEIFEALGLEPPRRNRRNCPICTTSTNPSSFSCRDDHGVWYCHSGAHGGDKATLVQEIQGCKRLEAIQFLAEIAGFDSDFTRAQWDQWRRIRQRQRETLRWISNVLTALRDLETAYRFGGSPSKRERVERWIQAVEALTGAELLTAFDARLALPNTATPAELALLTEQHRKRQDRYSHARAGAAAQITLLACEATPAEWEQAFERYLHEIQGNKDKKRSNQGATGRGRQSRSNDE